MKLKGRIRWAFVNLIISLILYGVFLLMPISSSPLNMIVILILAYIFILLSWAFLYEAYQNLGLQYKEKEEIYGKKH